MTDISPEEQAFGKKLEAEWRYGIPTNTPISNIEAEIEKAVQKKVLQKFQQVMTEQLAAQKRAQMSPPPRPIRTLTPDDPYGLKPRIKKPSRLKKLLARLGGHKSAKNV